MKRTVFYIFTAVVLWSCEQETNLEDVISNKWDLKWKKCGLYQNSVDAQIFFNLTDSTNNAWYREGNDTMYFWVSVVDNSTVLIDSSLSEKWEGEIHVEYYSERSLLLSRSNPQCEDESFSFE